ncbi:MAG: TldD/PmbA family protein [Bacilli bacterium]
MNYTELIKRSYELGFSDLEVYERTSSDLTIAIYNGVVDKNKISDVTVSTIRGIYNGKMASMILENLEEDIDFVLENLLKNAKSLTTEEEFMIYEGDKEYPKVKHVENDFSNYTNFDKAELLKQLELKVKQKDSRIVFVPYCNYQEVKSAVKITNSKGLNVEKTNQYCALIVQAVARENNDSQSGFKVDVKLRYDDLNVDKIVDDVVTKTVAMLNAKSIPSKNYPVIIENDAMTDLLSSFMSVFSGEAAIKKLTPLLEKENQLIMSDLVTIVDDPMCSEAIMNEPFDDEGVACYKKEIVSNGVFKTFLHNLKTAKYFKTKSTGNGFKSGSTITVSGANVYITPGEKSKNDLIKEMNEGLLLTTLEGLHAGVNAISGDFSLKAQGFLVEKGQVSRAVTLIVAAGNFYKLMKDVVAVGNDLEIGHQGIAAPSILFKGIAISGE